MHKTREVTNKLLEMVEEGILDRDTLIIVCLTWMSEDDVREMAEANEFIFEEESEEENDT